MLLALYGHKDSGGHWERHCEDHLFKVGFTRLSEHWPSCYYHKRLRLMLCVYVDDFKLSGPTENHAEGWRLIRQGLKLDDLVPLDDSDKGLYLGVIHRTYTKTRSDGTKVRIMEYDVEHQLDGGR